MMKRRKTERLAYFLIAWVITIQLLFTMAGSVMAQNGENNLLFVHPTEDAMILEIAGGNNYGTWPTSNVHVDGDALGKPYKRRYALLKYEIPEDLIESGGKYTISDVRITATVWSYSETPQVLVQLIANDWSEDTVTWDTMPNFIENIGMFNFNPDENFDTYEKVYADLSDFTFTSGTLSIALTASENDLGAIQFRDIELLTRESGQFGTIEFVYIRIYIVPPALVALALLLTLAFAGFGLYKKLGDIHDMDSLIEGWVFLIYLSILIITAVVLAWTFIG